MINGANLTDANFGRANLTNADFEDADLTRAILDDANLTDAELERANLEDANLNGALLSNAVLNDANLEDTNLPDSMALSRLCLILAMATAYLVSTGVTVDTLGFRPVVDTHWRRGLSFLQIGWR